MRGENRPENMLASLAALKSKYGGAEGYMKQECGLDDEDIRKIRANLVERAS